jgi:hypothetical protein
MAMKHRACMQAVFNSQDLNMTSSSGGNKVEAAIADKSNGKYKNIEEEDIGLHVAIEDIVEYKNNDRDNDNKGSMIWRNFIRGRTCSSNTNASCSHVMQALHV